MSYNTNLGPYIPCIGVFDTIANLRTLFPPANMYPGVCAFTQDYGWVWVDGTVWRAMGVGGSSAKQIVTSGASATVSSGVQNVYLNGVNTTFTLTLPAPIGDGQELYINATTAVSVALTLTPTAPATTVKNAPATLAAGVGIGYQYNSSDTTWYRIY